MKRKVNLVGKGTLTVSLPAKWAEKNKISKGDELNLEETSNSLTLTAGVNKTEKKEISINIDNYSYGEISKTVSAAYKANYDRIILTYNRPDIYFTRKKDTIPIKTAITHFVNRLIGAEVISQTQKSSEIRCFAVEDTPDLEKIEKRIYFLLKESIRELLESIDGDFSNFQQTVYAHHDNVTKFTSHYLRVLHTANQTEERTKMAYAIHQSIDILVDRLRYITNAITKHGCSKKTKKMLEEIFDLFFNYFSLISDTTKWKQLLEQKYKVKEKIDKGKWTVNDMQVIAQAVPFIDLHTHFMEYGISKKI